MAEGLVCRGSLKTTMWTLLNGSNPLSSVCPGNVTHQAPVVRIGLDCAIHWIKLYPVDNALRFSIAYPLDSVILPLYNWTQVSRIFTSVDAVITNKFLLLYVHSSPDAAFIC